MASTNLFINLITIFALGSYAAAIKCTCIKNGEVAICVNKQQQTSNQDVAYANTNAFDLLLSNAVPFTKIKSLRMHCDIQNVDFRAFKNQETLTYLDLSSNLIDKLPSHLFHFTPELATLNLSRNKFKTSNMDTFASLKKLKSLDLSYNSLRKINMGNLDDMVLLETLLLNNNDIRELPAGVLDELVNLKTIDLSINKLTSIEINLFGSTKQLEDVNISGNELGRENALVGLAELTSVVNLDLSHCEIVKLPSNIFKKLTNLKKINLNSNPLTLLPDTFTNANSLTTIHMSKCGLASIPAHLFDYNSKLEKLDISQNQLTTLHESLLNNSLDFKYLNISHNLFSDLPIKIFQWTSLTEIDLSFNKFTTLLPELLNMETLDSIYAHHNEISFLEDATFSSCTFPIVYIDLSYNRLVYLQEYFFDWLANLEKLKIFGNPWDCKCLQNLIDLLNNRFIQYDEEDYQKTAAICVAGDPQVCPYYSTNLTHYYDVFRKTLLN